MKQATTRAGATLRDWIVSQGMTIPTFSEKSGIHRLTLQRLITGNGSRRVSVTLALAIQRATGGAVPIETWADASAESAA